MRSRRIAIGDARLSPSSQAYQTFFKDITYAPFIIAVLTNIIAGNPKDFGHGRMLSPMLICANKPGDFPWISGTSGKTKDIYSDFQRSNKETLFEGVYISGTPFIAICRNFGRYDHPSIPTKNNCMGINVRPSRFHAIHAREKAMVYYQAYLLLHELVHFYVLQMSPSKGYADGHLFDEYGVNDCFWLTAFKSSMNANNYVYYVESKQRA